jgi:hypothetical protein
MLHIISTMQDNFIEFIEQDPVRPEISAESRIGKNKEVIVLLDTEISELPLSIICVSYQNTIPNSTEQLFEDCLIPDIAVFYSVWSYAPGCGRNIILKMVNYMMKHKPEIRRMITLSPSTDIVKKFHITNGASEYRVNVNTTNYEYYFK